MAALLLNPRDQFTADGKAPQACGNCKRQKRKCDKAFPSCGLCSRMERCCDYAEPQKPAPTAEDFAALQLKLVELEDRLKNASSETSSVSRNGVGQGHYGSSSGASMGGLASPPASASSGLEPLWEQQSAVQFPPDVFLDIVTYECLNQPVPKPSIDIPADVLEHLSDETAVQTSIGAYFATIHPWLPIISKKRMQMGVILSQGGPDPAMLSLAMVLMTTHPTQGLSCAQMPKYRSAKRFVSLLEHSGATSLMVLQSMVLIAYFEYAHGIYPAAWITIGSCVRYADFLGLPGFHEGNILLSSPTTWTELEERKRTWWAILILDRFICIGNKKRYLSPEPLEHESFPADDKAWDEGRVGRALHQRVSSPCPSTSSSSPFSSLCRSALLTGQVLRHVRDIAAGRKQSSNAPSEDPQVPDVTSLSASLASELGSLPKDLIFLGPRGVLMSNAILLHDFYCCPANPDGRIWNLDETEQQARSVEDMRNLSREIAQLASEILLLTFSMEKEENGKGSDIGVISPLVLDALYGAANTLAWLAREEGSAECEEAVENIKRCLSRLGARWRLAVEYGRMLEEQAFAYMMQDQGHSKIRGW
ncbi:fungal specific transcription factor domain-containing protein [Colletotrichum truncatum]|uniref:Fungal specific transcription factor domain-containing protein n=1 Tax=Colletotrichum truncatum TaxID=5467 RepID=A0ACC3YT59_COLTU|nr:fungal specific transcription factor domain-containing protein [Colletotrichum truncatum]KAF6798311.1 fungal specific transcription factor domain-containing protein [Colletotrichum truncatum]